VPDPGAGVLDLAGLWQLAWTSQRAIYTSHCHGIEHWVRVERNGLWLASRLGEVDTLVVRLFAAFHDCQRHHDGSDLAHGPRAADLVLALGLPLEEPRLDRLAVAIRTHTTGTTTDDPTIQVCHDADRLDLGRVGTRPSPRYLSTLPARDMAARDAVADLDRLRFDVTCPEWLVATPRWDGR
jgi:uncharacterized protein